MTILINFNDLFNKDRVIPSFKNGKLYRELYQNVFNYFQFLLSITDKCSKLTNINESEGRTDINSRNSDLDELGLFLFQQREYITEENESVYDSATFDQAVYDGGGAEVLWSDSDYRFLILMNCKFNNFRCTIDDYLKYFSVFFNTTNIFIDLNNPFVLSVTINTEVSSKLKNFILEFLKLPLCVKLDINYG